MGKPFCKSRKSVFLFLEEYQNLKLQQSTTLLWPIHELGQYTNGPVYLPTDDALHSSQSLPYRISLEFRLVSALNLPVFFDYDLVHFLSIAYSHEPLQSPILNLVLFGAQSSLRQEYFHHHCRTVYSDLD